MQVQEAVSPSETYLTNAAEATGKGVELELTATPYQGLDIHAGFAANIVEYDKFSDSSGDYKGNQNPFSPKYSCNLGIQYRHRSGYYTRADLVGYSKMYLDKANAYARDAYQLVNAKIGYEAAHFDVYVYARNLFDETYDSVGYFGGSYVIYSDPREIGARLVYRF
jgi:iron complex outermembrane receptor protein